MRSDRDREGDAEQEDAAPVPENDFARGVESVGDGDGGEDGSEGSPGSEDFRFGVPDGGGLQNGGRKAVEGEGEEASSVAAEAAGDVPERGAEKDSEGEKWNAGKPAPVRFGIVQAVWPGEQGRGGYQGRAESARYRSRNCLEKFL